MRDLKAPDVDRYRLSNAATIAHYGWAGDGRCGKFVVPSPIDGGELRVIASGYEGWDHVSVSRKNRCPNWIEMSFIKRLFFRPDETAMQLHVPEDEHLDCHPQCLHLWRPHGAVIPRPPAEFVAPASPGRAGRAGRSDGGR